MCCYNYSISKRGCRPSSTGLYVQRASDSHSAPRAAARTGIGWRCTLPRVPPFPTRLPACSLGLNGLTANSQWHQIYRSQQRSLSLGKGLMLAETLAHTNGQTLGIIIYKIWARWPSWYKQWFVWCRMPGIVWVIHRSLTTELQMLRIT